MSTNGPKLLIIERILRDRQSIWQQIVDDRELNGLTGQMLVSSAIALAVYGAVLGWFNGPLMSLTSAVKLPLLFLVTLAICLPTLYLFNLVFGARLSVRQSVALVMVAITVTAMLALAFAPISLFFLITAPNYGFFKLLNVTILALSAIVGLRFLTGGMQVLHEHGLLSPATTGTLAGGAGVGGAGVGAGAPAVGAPAGGAPAGGAPATVASVMAAPAAGSVVAASPGTQSVTAPVPAAEPVPVGVGATSNGDGPAAPAPAAPPVAVPVPALAPAPVPAMAAPAGAPHVVHWPDQRTRYAQAARVAPQQRPASMTLLYIWILLFGFVGTQLAWTLRPFFGNPDSPFALFREIDGNFYAEIIRTIGGL